MFISSNKRCKYPSETLEKEVPESRQAKERHDQWVSTSTDVVSKLASTLPQPLRDRSRFVDFLYPGMSVRSRHFFNGDTKSIVLVSLRLVKLQ